MLESYSCPIAVEEEKVITLAHGSGGKHTHRLIEQIFQPAFSNEHLNLMHDGAFLELDKEKIVFTTDSYVVQPVFFPGGDIGKLAMTGTINDLAMCGAKPKYLSAGFIIEEGFSQKDLKRIVQSMKQEAEAQSVYIVTGDTKVIERSTGTNIFINTSGIGTRLVDEPINPLQIQPGDAIILSGDIGRHGMAVMAKREGLAFASPLLSDCSSLSPLVQSLIEEEIQLHCLRDATRGGLATTLVELSESAEKEFLIEEEAIPISDAVESACEILGFDPLYVANEGRFIAFVSSEEAEKAVQILQKFSEGREATLIGHVLDSPSSGVRLKNPYGSERYLYRLMGDQLPRIC